MRRPGARGGLHRQGNPDLRANGGNISTFEETGDTRDIAAAKADLGSGKTLEAAQKVIERDIPELVEAMARVPPRSPMDRVLLDLSD